MQFKHHLRSKGVKKGEFDCTSCRGKNHKCFLRQREIKINSLDHDGKGRREVVMRSAKDLYRYIDLVRRGIEPNASELELILFAHGSDICPIPIISEFSFFLYQMVQVCGDHLFPFPGGYLDQPAFYYSAIGIIRQEEFNLSKRSENV